MTLDVAALALVALLSPGPGNSQQPTAFADELAKGRRLVSEQKYQEAVVVLVRVVAKLPWTGPDPAAAEVFLQLGLAYAGLGQESQANLQFLQALRRDPMVAPDPQTTPAASLKVFASAVKEAGEIDLVEKAEKKRGKGIWVAAGAGALLAGGAVLLAGGESAPGADNGSVPIISNLTIGEIVSVDGTVGVFSLEFDFMDPDGDINSVTIWVGGLVAAASPLPEAAAKREGHVRITESVRLPTRGVTVSVRVHVTDHGGRRSNTLLGSTVWP